MKLPERNRHWLKEIEKAFSKAESLAAKESSDIAYLYRYAPDFVVKARGISETDVVREMKDDIEARVKQDWSFDEASKLHYKFHFVSSYIFAHVPAGLLKEMEGDRVMDYVNKNMNLFER